MKVKWRDKNGYAMQLKTKLYVKEAYVNEGQTMKRIKFGSRGHVDPIKKRTSHITIVVGEK